MIEKLQGQLGFFEQIGIKETYPSEGKYAILDLTKDNPHWIESSEYENVSEKPNEDNPTFLSQILERNVDPKYYLSDKACKGILRRAEERGKELPNILKKALMGQANKGEVYAVNQGAGKGSASVSKECSPTLDCAHGGAPAINEPDAAAFLYSSGKSAHDIGYNEEKSPTLIAGNKPAVMAKVIDNHPSDSRFTESKDNKVPTLSAKMGTGGNNGPMILEEDCIACIEGNGTRPSHKGAGINDGDKSYTLNATEEHAVVTTSKSSFFLRSNEELADTLIATDYKDPQIVAMSQNQREEVRDLGDKASALTAEQGTHHQTFVAFHKTSHPKNKEEGQGWEEADVSDTLNIFDQGEMRTPTLAVELGAASREGGHVSEEKTGTLRATMGDNQVAVVYGADQYNGEIEEEKEGTLGENRGMSTGRNAVVLNDQGGERMNVEKEEVSPTLRAQDHGHPPIVCGEEQKVFGIGSKDSNAMKSSNPQSGIYEADTSKTLDLNGGNPACNQGGMAVVEKTYGVDQQGGKGEANYTEDVSPTLMSNSHGTPHAVCFSDVHATLSADDGPKGVHSQSMKNPEENFVADFVKEVNESAEHQQDQLNDPNGVSRTLAAGTHGSAPHLTKTMVKEGGGYTVRRLTPTECARLQGLPDYWVKDLADPNPTEEEIDKWYQIFEDYRKAITHGSKPKSRESVKTFLKNPYSDSAAYKMFGNGIAVWCAVYVFAGIVWAENNALEE